MALEPGVVFTIPVQAERADEFETWVRAVLVPAVERTHRMPRFGLYRTDAAPAGTALYLVIGEGSDSEGFELPALFVEAYGEQRAVDEAATFRNMLAGDQDLWVLTAVA